jgi:hypothetical protein
MVLFSPSHYLKLERICNVFPQMANYQYIFVIVLLLVIEGDDLYITGLVDVFTIEVFVGLRTT